MIGDGTYLMYRCFTLVLLMCLGHFAGATVRHDYAMAQILGGGLTRAAGNVDRLVVCRTHTRDFQALPALMNATIYTTTDKEQIHHCVELLRQSLSHPPGAFRNRGGDSYPLLFFDDVGGRYAYVLINMSVEGGEAVAVV